MPCSVFKMISALSRLAIMAAPLGLIGNDVTVYRAAILPGARFLASG